LALVQGTRDAAVWIYFGKCLLLLQPGLFRRIAVDKEETGAEQRQRILDNIVRAILPKPAGGNPLTSCFLKPVDIY